MPLFRKKRKISTGLEVANDVFRVLSLEAGDNAYVAIRDICEEIPRGLCPSRNPFCDEGAHLSPLFKYIAGRVNSFDGGVSIALPPGAALIHVVNLPGLNLEEARAALRYRISDYFPFSEDECVYDVATVDFPGSADLPEERFVVAAASRKLVENISRAADGSHIRIVSIEPPQVALERSITPLSLEEKGIVYVYIGKRSSVLVLSWRGNGIFYSSLNCGVDRDILQGDGEYEDICPEIAKGINFAVSHCSGFNADVLRLFGPGASPSLCALLADSTKIHSAEVSDPFNVHHVSGIASNIGYEIALGLALR